MEIERKFLVARQPEPDEGSVRIEQGYLALTDGEGGAEVRLRRKGDALLLTVKGGEGRTRTEEEFRLDRARFESLWPLTSGRRLSKERRLIPLGELEVEFPDEASADSFEKRTGSAMR